MEIPNASAYENCENLENDNNLKENERELNLVDRINLAIKDARPLDEADEEDKKTASLINDFISGRINLNEFNKRNEKEVDVFKLGTVELASLEELSDCLMKIFGDEEVVKELTDHEREHFNKVIEFGWMAKILCRFFKDENNSISLRPGILPDIPKGGNEKEIRDKLKLIIEAPNDQSDTDEIAIKS